MASIWTCEHVQFHIIGVVGQSGSIKHSKPIYLSLLPIIPLNASFSNAMYTIEAAVNTWRKKEVHLLSIRVSHPTHSNINGCNVLWFRPFTPNDVQDSSLQCPSNAIWPFQIYLSPNNPAKRNPILKMKTSLEVLSIIYPPQEPASVMALSLPKLELDARYKFFTLY